MFKAAAHQFCLAFLSWLRRLWQGKLFRSGLRRLTRNLEKCLCLRHAIVQNYHKNCYSWLQVLLKFRWQEANNPKHRCRLHSRRSFRRLQKLYLCSITFWKDKSFFRMRSLCFCRLKKLYFRQNMVLLHFFAWFDFHKLFFQDFS